MTDLDPREAVTVTATLSRSEWRIVRAVLDQALSARIAASYPDPTLPIGVTHGASGPALNALMKLLTALDEHGVVPTG